VDFGDIIKRAWQITWRYKALWVLGLFAGASGGFGGWGGSGYRFDGGSTGDLGARGGEALSAASAHLSEWAPLIIAASVLVFLVGLLFLVVSIAAQSGLAFEVDQAADARPVSLHTGWSVGFHYWGRVAVVSLVLMVPGLVVALMVLAVVVAALERWVAAAILLLVGFGALLVPVLIVLSFALSIIYPLAVRYVAIENRGSKDALMMAWGALRHRLRDVFLMWLVVFALGLGFGFAIAIPAGALGVGAVLAARFGAWQATALLGLLLAVAVIALGAVWSTFTSALWTLFFRRLTGRDLVASPTGPASSTLPAAPQPPDPQ
jgi:hypothetical protein